MAGLDLTLTEASPLEALQLKLVYIVLGLHKFTQWKITTNSLTETRYNFFKKNQESRTRNKKKNYEGTQTQIIPSLLVYESVSKNGSPPQKAVLKTVHIIWKCGI